MRDSYLYDDAPVLRNLLGIKDAKKLEQAEADIAAFALTDVDSMVESKDFNLSRLLTIHN